MTYNKFGTILVLAAIISSVSTGLSYAREAEVRSNVNLGISGPAVYVENDDSEDEVSTNSNTGVRTIVHEGLKDWSFNNGIMGTVTAIDGTTIKLHAVRGDANYTVDASNATYRKGDILLALSSIKVGAMLFVQGAINENSIVASAIVDAKGGMPIPPVKGKHQPGIVGTVTEAEKAGFKVQTRDGAIYMVNAFNAKIWKNKTVASVGDIAVGDTVVVVGTITDMNIAATSVATVSLPSHDNNENVHMNNGVRVGFFHRIGLFFRSMFGKHE